MLELGLSGSVRGVPSNGHPYRDPGSIGDIRTVDILQLCYGLKAIIGAIPDLG